MIEFEHKYLNIIKKLQILTNEIGIGSENKTDSSRSCLAFAGILFKSHGALQLATAWPCPASVPY